MHLNVYNVFYSHFSHQHVSAAISATSRKVAGSIPDGVTEIFH
jgi:hypothetical protein